MYSKEIELSTKENLLLMSTRRTPYGIYPDPIALQILREKEKSEILSCIPEGCSLLTGGATSLVLKTLRETVVRIGPIQSRPAIDEMLQPIRKFIVGSWQIEELPLAETSSINEYDVQVMSERLKSKGYEFTDPGTDNLGRVRDSLVVLDAGAVHKL